MDCHFCSKGMPETVAGFDLLGLVTSDCKPFEGKSRLTVCMNCGFIQKAADDNWRVQSGRIYRAYTIYYQSDGEDQMVFDAQTGSADPRSEQLIGLTHGHVDLPETGRLLDMGCGNGAFLRAFQRRIPGWKLSATEFDLRFEGTLSSIPGFEGLYRDFGDPVPGYFDIISLIHLLEHIPNPQPFLMAIKNMLTGSGKILLQVPNFMLNPFDLLIFDHCSHFVPDLLETATSQAGFQTALLVSDRIPKETTYIGMRGTGGNALSHRPDLAEQSLNQARRAVEWLCHVRKEALGLSKRNRFGIFGTSIAGTWLFAETKGAVEFFVDENPYCIEKTVMGRPVYHPEKVPRGSTVYIALPHKIAVKVKHRLSAEHSTVHWLCTPSFKCNGQNQTTEE
jgi:2-polyprenyl-3-methyl-5-hydroxy-6-metoxy-1,4-benzoquinol methylase